MNRKQFIKNAGLTAASLALLPANDLFANSNAVKEKVRLMIIGVGLRGQNHLELLLKRIDVELVAICDIDDRMLAIS